MNTRKLFHFDFQQSELKDLKLKMLNWMKPFSIFSYMDNNAYTHQPNRFEILLGAGVQKSFLNIPKNQEDWVFGHVNYDFKNKIIPQLISEGRNDSGFNDCFFFVPEIVLSIPFGTTTLTVETLDESGAQVVQDILNQNIEPNKLNRIKTEWQFSISKSQYLENVRKIQNHIIEGDFYELNFCVEAAIQINQLNPFGVFQKLNEINPSPFAAFYRNQHSYLMTASPERFLYKKQNKIVSQPIKGTIQRQSNANLDKQQKETLKNDEKERAENVMIVDLVRNDLAQCCEVGTIKVTELFGVYSFPHLHHLISTIQGQLLPNQSLFDIFKVSFPMGSMTGAPKRIVMEMIEQYEEAKRGLYAGTIGYIMPGGDFDFNVVIRSLIYNDQNGVLSYQTGGAITYDSIPEKEWAEIKLKAKAMEAVFLNIEK